MRTSARVRLINIVTAIVLFTAVFISFQTKAAEAYLFVSRDWENSQKEAALNEAMERDGVNTDSDLNVVLDRVSGNIINAVENQEKITVNYTFFVNQRTEVNAYCTLGGNISVNTGMFTFTNNEDELAFIIGHEVGHAQGEHILKSIDGAITTGIIASLILGKTDNGLLVAIAYQHIMKKGFGLKHEWDADRRGFIYATAAGYNPGAGAAVFQRMTEKYGDKHVSPLGEILMPEEHPTNKQRINKFIEQLYTYSGNKVTTNGVKVLINGKEIVTPAPYDEMSAAERTYLIAGNIAKVLHDEQSPMSARVVEDYYGVSIVMGTYPVMTVISEDGSAYEIASKINNALNL